MTDVFGREDLFSAFAAVDTEQQQEGGEAATENGCAAEMPEQVEAWEEEEVQAGGDHPRQQLRLHERYADLLAGEHPVAAIDYFQSHLSLECQARIEAELYTVLSEQRDAADEVAGKRGPLGQVLYLPHCILDAAGRHWEKTPVQYGEHTPYFDNIFSVVLDDREDKLDMFGAKLPKDSRSTGPECFNCGGPHRLADCKEPKDKRKIAENLRLFKESRGGANYSDRYHVRVAKEVEPRFKEFQPGKISSSLREALGLERQDLPSFIYRMRTYGYPPGYSLDPPLRNAQGMQLYHSKTTPAVSGTAEDGEIEEALLPCVIDYPGYTTPPDSHIDDKYRAKYQVYSSVTPMLSDKRRPRDQQATPKRRRVEQPLGEREEDDMDVKDDDRLEPAHSRPIIQQPPVPTEPPPRIPSPPPTAAPKKEEGEVKEEEEEENGEEEEEDLDRSIVSETNKIGIKFNQVEDYGPLDKKAGNFSKLQGILRKTPLPKTPKRKRK